MPNENKGLVAELPARQQFSFNLHYVNVSDVPILREVWLNVWYLDEQDVTAPMATFAATGNPADMAIPAGRAVKLEYECGAASASARLISMYGHYHAHNERFGAWILRRGERVAIYESFDEVNNTSNATLSFANETFTGEMCSLFAGYTGANPCTRVTRVN